MHSSWSSEYMFVTGTPQCNKKIKWMESVILLIYGCCAMLDLDTLFIFNTLILHSMLLVLIAFLPLQLIHSHWLVCPQINNASFILMRQFDHSRAHSMPNADGVWIVFRRRFWALHICCAHSNLSCILTSIVVPVVVEKLAWPCYWCPNHCYSGCMESDHIILPDTKSILVTHLQNIAPVPSEYYCYCLPNSLWKTQTHHCCCFFVASFHCPDVFADVVISSSPSCEVQNADSWHWANDPPSLSSNTHPIFPPEHLWGSLLPESWPCSSWHKALFGVVMVQHHNGPNRYAIKWVTTAEAIVIWIVTGVAPLLLYHSFLY